MMPASPSHVHSLTAAKGLRSLDNHKFLSVWEGAAHASGPETLTGLTATGNNCENLRTLSIPLKPGMEQTPALSQLGVMKENIGETNAGMKGGRNKGWIVVAQKGQALHYSERGHVLYSPLTHQLKHCQEKGERRKWEDVRTHNLFILSFSWAWPLSQHPSITFIPCHLISRTCHVKHKQFEVLHEQVSWL